jgi:hypothetical protein
MEQNVLFNKTGQLFIVTMIEMADTVVDPRTEKKY